MSRLFDALKGSISSRQAAGGTSTEEVWEALGIQGADIEKSQDDADISKVSAAPAEPPDDATLVFTDEEILQRVEDRRLDVPIGTEAQVTLDPAARLIPHSTDPQVAEYYRKLRTKITQQQAEHPFRSLVITSAGPQEGKTVTVLNLGLSFSLLPSFRVLVVDGDLRRGTLGEWLGVDNQHPGLSNIMDGSAQLEDVVLKSDEIPMDFIVRGNTQIPDPEASQLTTPFRRLTELYDLILVDSPPVNLISDVQLLAASCDAVLLVARAFSTTQKAFSRAVQELSPFRVIGTVLNARKSHQDQYREYSTK
jgi:capsular exopolysaccharide synthesis family protein